MSIYEFPSFFIEEPQLSFGNGKKHIDPKAGLWAYGPCMFSNRKLSSSIRVGIIGSRETVNFTQQWLNKCREEIPGAGEFPLFSPFPGFTTVFGSELLVLDACIELVTEAEIKRVVTSINFYQRVRDAANLFVEKLNNLREREPRPHVVICALPRTIINRCIDRYVTRRRTTRPLNIAQTTLRRFYDGDVTFELPEARNLRRLIKAKAMSLGIPTQLVKPTTIKPPKISTNPKDTSIQDEATRAWNFCVALYYKAEGYPWKLAEMKQGTCYVGISFYRELAGQNVRTSVAQVFTHTGEGLVLRGGRAIQDAVTKIPHLSEKVSFNLMSDAINLYMRQMRQYPTRLVVHKSSRFWPEELSGFKKAAEEIPLLDFVAIQDRGIRFMRKQGRYPPLRGTVVQVEDKDYILFTKGYIPYFKTYPGLRVPTPLEITEHHGDTPVQNICDEILSLTKMNWNSADFCIREPITLAYSREVGKILAYVSENIEPRPEYRFYM